MQPSPRLFYCDHHPIPLPPGHKFPVEKYALLRALLAGDGAYDLQPAPLADAATIELAHDTAYVQAILNGTASERVMRRIGFPWSPELVRRTLASVGGTLEASRDAMERGFGGNLAGGTHHAFRGEGAGFCVFNDLAVAILALRRDGLASRAAVIDLDVHQGDGTAAIFAEDPAVLTLSMHGENNFPFRKQRSRIDIALADGTGDAEYLRQLQQVLPEVTAFRPEVIFYQSGVDGSGGRPPGTPGPHPGRAEAARPPGTGGGARHSPGDYARRGLRRPHRTYRRGPRQHISPGPGRNPRHSP